MALWLRQQLTEANPTTHAGSPIPKDGPPVFDEKQLLAYLGGDRILAKAIIQAAMSAIPGDFEYLERAIAAGNWMEIERHTHILKGLVAQIGGMRLLACLDNYHKGDEKADNTTVIDLRREYQMLSAALPEWLR